MYCQNVLLKWWKVTKKKFKFNELNQNIMQPCNENTPSEAIRKTFELGHLELGYVWFLSLLYENSQSFF